MKVTSANQKIGLLFRIFTTLTQSQINLKLKIFFLKRFVTKDIEVGHFSPCMK